MDPNTKDTKGTKKEGLHPLPEGWGWMQLKDLVKNPKADIVDGPFGSDLKASEYVDAGIPIIRLQNIDRNHFVAKNIRFISPEKAKELQRHSFKKGDIVITKLGNPLGEACIVPDEFETGIIVADVVRVIPEERLVNKKYLTYAINSQSVIEQFEPLIKGSTRPRVNLGNVRELRIPVAPIREQERIVARLEELLSDLEAGVRALERVRAGAKRYKASVLKTGCEGKLSGNKGSGNQGLRDGELPEGWRWAKLPELGLLARGKSKHRPRNADFLYNGPYPFIQTGDIRHADGFITKYSQTYSEVGLAQSKLWPKGTLCITIAANIAETAILGFDSCFPDSVVGFIPNDNTDVKYVEFYFRTIKENLERFAPATAQKNINLDVLQKILVALPPLEEQRRIVAEVEQRLESVRAVEAAAEAGLKRAGRLRQAVLRSVFEGRMVFQTGRGK
jgi:type I restriction enzyme S subunit